MEYTKGAFFAARSLRLWPNVLRPLVHWFLPDFQALRGERQKAKSIIESEWLRRIGAGEMPNDSLQWLEDTASGREYSRTDMQLMLSTAAVHTTSDMIAKFLFDVCSHRHIIEPLREEIATELSKAGWRRSSMANLKLLDSALKESQRLSPTAIGKRNPSGNSIVSQTHPLTAQQHL